MSEAEYTYVFVPEAWYAKGRAEDSRITVTGGHGDGFWELEFVADLTVDGLRLEIWDESWKALADRPDLFSDLVCIKPGNFAQLRELLETHGFADMTPRRRS